MEIDMLSNFRKMENICRTCLRIVTKLSPIGTDDGLVHKIEKISSVRLSFNEYYPSSICEECLSNINKFYCFQKVIINTDKELQERYDTLTKTNFTSKPRSKQKFKECDSTKDELESEEGDDDKDNLTVAEDLLIDVINKIGTAVDDSKTNDTVAKASEVESIKKAIAKLSSAKCGECSLTFTSRIKLNNHRRTVHVAPGVCDICKIVVRADNLRRHIQMHKEGPATCKICQKIFKNPESLRGHLLYHKGLQFTCEICGKTSRVKSEHRRHVMSHTDPTARKIMCTFCGKQVRDLKRHIQTHTGERPHKCTYCKRGFTSTYALKIHTRQHTNERPFSCEYCGAAFPQKVSLVAHLKSKHDAIFS